MKNQEFAELCQRGVLYVYPSTRGRTITRGGIESNGAVWIYCGGEAFHVLAITNLNEREFSGGVTWEDSEGVPAFTIMDESTCEECNPAELARERDTAFAEVSTAAGADWYRIQIAGARALKPDALKWIRPGRAASDAPPE